MAEKGLNLFDECAAEYVHLYPQEEEWTSSSWGDSKMYTPGTVANSHRTPTKINENVPIAKIKNFSGASDTVRYLKTFRVISNETLVLLPILCWWYFSCLQMYSDTFFNVYFYEQIFFLKSLWQKETQASFFEK